MGENRKNSGDWAIVGPGIGTLSSERPQEVNQPGQLGSERIMVMVVVEVDIDVALYLMIVLHCHIGD